MVNAKQEPAEGKNIYSLISTISKEAGALPTVAKGGVPFAFRGIDDVVAHLAPFLQKYGVITIPRVLERNTTLREVGSKAITQSDLLVSFKFVAPDGSFEEAITNGLAQDYADRSAAQAQSVAYRVALLQTFTLPTHSKDPEEAAEDVQKVIAAEQAKTASAKPQAAAAGPSASVLTAQIKGIIAAGEITNEATGEVHKVTPDQVNTIGRRIAGTGPTDNTWKQNPEFLKATIKALSEGVTK